MTDDNVPLLAETLARLACDSSLLAVVDDAAGSPLSLANLGLLCEFHHRQVHESGFAIFPLGSRRFRFLRPDGRPVPESPQPVPAAGRLEDAQRDLRINDDTIASGWLGERLDLDAALFALLNPPNRAPAASTPN